MFIFFLFFLFFFLLDRVSLCISGLPSEFQTNQGYKGPLFGMELVYVVN